MHRSYLLAGSTLAFASLIVPSATFAQAGDEIVVTAQKRAQPINEVPATISIVEGDTVEISAGNDLRSVIERVPGAAFNGRGFSGNNSVSLRGLGGLATFGPYDSAVSFTIDEHVVPLRSFDAMMLDVQRVEVLKGPQGTLYGRSTIGGAVNVVTRDLEDEWGGGARVEVGENGYLALNGAGGGALNERLLVRGAIRYTEYDGDVENTLTDDDLNGAEIFAGRVSAKALLSEMASLKFSYQTDREDRTPTTDLLRDAPGFPIAGQSGLPRASRDTDRLSLRFENDFGGYRLVALAGLENSEIGNSFDLTDSILAPVAFGVPAQFTTDPTNDRSVLDTDEETVSAEVRLQSDGNGPLEWIIGAIYLDLAFDRTVSRRSNIPPFNVDELSSNDNATYGVFADLSYDLSDKLTVGGGIRVARDEVQYEGTTDFFGPLAGTPRFLEASEFDDDYVVGNVRALYDLGAHTLFARYARGHASGGYGEFAANALARQPINPFAATTNDSFEAGLRGTRASLAYSLALFYNDVSDGQVYQFDATTFSNIAENLDYETYGIDATATATLAEWAVLDLGLGLQRARFKNIPVANLSGASDGNRVPLAPNVTLSAALSGDVPFNLAQVERRAFYNVSVQHIGKRANDPANAFDLSSYTLIDGRLGVSLDKVDIYVFGSNIGNERAELYGQNFGTPAFPIATVNINRGRVLGAGIAARF